MMTEVIVPCVPNSKINIHPKGIAPRGGLCDLHLHDECEFSKLYDGEYIWYVNDKEIHLEEEDIIFVNSRVPHQTMGFAGTTSFLLHVDADAVTGRDTRLPRRFISYFEEKYAVIKAGTRANMIISECFENINRENMEQGKHFDMFIRAEMLKVFSVLYREGILKSPEELFNCGHIERILPVLDYVDEHFKENITLNDITDVLNVNKAHFCRIFKKTVGMSFVQYLNLVRVFKAEKLLLTTDMPISEIAEKTGFSSPTYFTEIFKLNMHYSPSRYKKIRLQN